jgi:hypothetical protein
MADTNNCSCCGNNGVVMNQKTSPRDRYRTTVSHEMILSAAAFSILMFCSGNKISATEPSASLAGDHAYQNGSQISALYSPQKSISYESFGREFLFTDSIADYRRSLIRVRDNYKVDINPLSLLSLDIDVPIKKQTKISLLSEILAEQARLKSLGHEEQFYEALQLLIAEVKTMNEAAFVEMQLVDLQRQLINKITPADSNIDTTRFSYLIQHSRYELFTSTIHRHL